MKRKHKELKNILQVFRRGTGLITMCCGKVFIPAEFKCDYK